MGGTHLRGFNFFILELDAGILVKVGWQLQKSKSKGKKVNNSDSGLVRVRRASLLDWAWTFLDFANFLIHMLGFLWCKFGNLDIWYFLCGSKNSWFIGLFGHVW